MCIRDRGGWVAGSRIPDPRSWTPGFPHHGSRIPVILAQVGSRWPQDCQNGLPRPPRCFENASGRPQDDLKIDTFEAFVRKTRKCVWSYYSNVFLIFREVFFHRVRTKTHSKFCEFWALLPHMPQEASRWPQDRLRWLSGGNLGPT